MIWMTGGSPPKGDCWPLVEWGHPDSKSDCNVYLKVSSCFICMYIYIYSISIYIYTPLKIIPALHPIDYHIPIPSYPYQTEKDDDICSADSPLENWIYIESTLFQMLPKSVDVVTPHPNFGCQLFLT